MVDTNQEPVQNKGSVKKKKSSPKKTAAKNKTEEKAVVKKLPLKKESAPAKPQSTAKVPASSKKPALANAKKFFKGAWSELKKVHWPNRRELVTFTGVVLVAVTFVAVLIFLVDSALSEILSFIVPK